MHEELVGSNQTPNMYQTTDENEQREPYIEINPESCSMPLSIDEEKLRIIFMDRVEGPEQSEDMQL